MNQKITHSGIIESLEPGCAHVRIVQTSACAACKVAGYCNASEKKEKIIDVFCDTRERGLAVGQTVTVSTTPKVARRALLWGFGLPLVIMLGVLFVILLLTGDEGFAAMGGLLALAPYYLFIWLMRDKMREQLSFEIE
jgi:sigma-E factor negative regulatory protein RseC